ncbi:MAG: hypothetical protein C4321_10445, partial [Chloroflexota bacterium]
PLLFGPLFRVLAKRLLLVSDAIPLAGRGDGRGRLGSLEVTVRGREARLADGTLAGSVTPLDEAVAIAVGAGVPLTMALGAASEVPARLLGLRGLGALRVGARADVVLTNPTHLAVALAYEPGAPAPVVLAKGAGAVAERIKAEARRHGVPVMENRPLARALFRAVDVGDPVPVALWRAVAEVLAVVYRLRRSA